MDAQKAYIAIDLKSFYASVECTERGLDALNTNLVVADESRTEKTICLAVSPSLKSLGIPGRARLFEVVERVKQSNALRKLDAPGREFTGKSVFKSELDADNSLEIGYITARPRMAYYMEYSKRILAVYTKYVSFDDIHVYSIDEVFMDVTSYLKTYNCTARELAKRIIHEVYEKTGITATAGVATNLYLCKVAMDVVAKHIPADENGVRIAELDEMSYRKSLWSHRPLTDFWRIGKGIAGKLEKHGMYTMGDIARCSVGKPNETLNESFLYRLFGVNAETLIDHAWGWEPCEIKDIKAYKPESNSLSSGQVLSCPYENDKARLVLKEMADGLSLALVDKKMKTSRIALTVVYDIDNLNDEERMKDYKGTVEPDYYGRECPKPSHGTVSTGEYTSSTRLIVERAVDLFDEITHKPLLIRRMYIVAADILPENAVTREENTQLDMFTDYEEESRKQAEAQKRLTKERRCQETLLDIKKRFGKNSIVRGMNLEQGATAMERNGQIGGHKA